ncbi:FRG domain-containing protein [Eubacterium sp. AF36-5BH]|uniref:FRG domain-containing protein n=1 Tax=Eubacterium sp. AF36-5BH TaxID=2293108 RepID=UPI001313FC44|nr:FRG domain-containing protein [Eubacterium sp. AF36-5BH]
MGLVLNNEKEKHLILNTDNGIEIKSVDDYIKKVGILNSNKNNPSAQLFFRGQAVDYWNISSTIVRDKKLGIEHYLMSEPLRQIPNEFVNIGDGFEIMEKYQHYGMCTRLLDVTTNPLVALYFACEHHKEEEYTDSVSKESLKMSPMGIVYFKEENAPLKYDDFEVRIISKLASYDLNESRTLEEVIHKLYEDKIISGEQLKTWSNDKGLLEFINICQNVFTVLPIMNNDRLIRQSGAFLLPGQFNIECRKEKIKDAVITKAEANLRSEFEKEFFYIDDEDKEKVRRELEHCNISEANLFPELEYQLNYIRNNNNQQKRAVSDFKRFEIFSNITDERLVVSDEYNLDDIKKSIIESGIEEKLADDLMNILKENQEVDWLKRERVLSRIRVLMCKKLIKNNYSKRDAENIVKNLIDKIIEKYTTR